MKTAFLFSLLFFTSLSWAVSFDWSGWTRAESYYQTADSDESACGAEGCYYGSYHLMLQPRLHIMDGLSISSRFELGSLDRRPLFSPSAADRQTGLVFLYRGGDDGAAAAAEGLFLELSQVFFDYETEFWKLRIGRAPFHFGSGLVYKASEDPFAHFLSAHNQLAFYFQRHPFYLQPSLIQSSKASGFKASSVSALAQGGLIMESWRLEAFYRYGLDGEDSENLAEVFGRYQGENWNIEGSLSYVFQDEAKMALAFLAQADLPLNFPVKFELQALGLQGGFALNPAYTIALIYGNRLMSFAAAEGSSSQTLKIRDARFSGGIYSSAAFSASFFNEALEVRPLLFAGRDSKTQKIHYEFDLEGNYKLEEGLFISLKGGLLKEPEDLHLAILAQAAVSF